VSVAEEIYDYTRNIDSVLKEDDTIDEVKKRIVDSIYVAFGARNSGPVKISKGGLLPSKGKLNSPIYFDRRKASIDIATFINGCMTRYLDYNDTYLSKEALHPSDNIPPILSYGYASQKDGANALKAVAAAYQIVGALSDAVSIRDRGWDHVTYISISSAVGLAMLDELPKSQFINAINLAINNNISLRQTRAGELSMWKGCTAANASRNSIFALLLAREGFTGPSPIFEGEMGFFRQVSGDMTLKFDANRILKTMIKNYPVEYHAMSAIEAALQAKNDIGTEEINNIVIDTFSVAHKIIVKDPEKLRPKTKETADHSMPYMIAYTLLYGEPGLQSFEGKYLEDPAILKLIDKMTFNISQEYDSLYPEYLPIKISVQTKSGTVVKEIRVPKGHFRNPYSWNDLRNKGERIMEDRERAERIAELGMRLDRMTVREFIDGVNEKR
jgi:2-methylcitrate dehydratase